MTTRNTVTAANRFGLGARPGDLDRIGGKPRPWLLQQLEGPSRLHPDLAALPGSEKVLAEVQALRRSQREMRRKGNDDVKAYGRTVRRHYVDQAAARYSAAVQSDLPFHERLVHFWSNHFAISADKQPLPAIAGLFENEAVRPNVTGKFSDLLMAVEKHPAMILYLDNQRSTGPASAVASRVKNRAPTRQIGLNENLAREILELHTLGVHGGYTQKDVSAFARVLTGWSIGGTSERGQFAEGDPGRFHFRDNIHEPGSQTILGTRYRQQGVRQGEAVLRDLATHPSTARFVSEKLARHFVSDNPPPLLLDSLVNAFSDSGGDLSVVCEVLVTADESWDAVHGKYKSPHDFVLSTLRAFDHVPDNRRFIVAALDLLGQPPFRPGSPEGWPDTAEQWGGADALYKRIEWSNTVARAVGSRVNPVQLGEAALGPAFSDETRKAVSRAESLSQGVTLLLASPDFQRR
jgi:uncharacterized protein (DUF1800 family)